MEAKQAEQKKIFNYSKALNKPNVTDITSFPSSYNLTSKNYCIGTYRFCAYEYLSANGLSVPINIVHPYWIVNNNFLIFSLPYSTSDLPQVCKMWMRSEGGQLFQSAKLLVPGFVTTNPLTFSV